MTTEHGDAAAVGFEDKGRVQISVLWPQRDLPGFRARQLPLSTNSIVVSVIDGGGKPEAVTPLMLSRPPGGNAAAGQAELVLNRGSYRFEALAYREASPGPQAEPTARGTAADVQVRSGRVTKVELSLTALSAPAITGLSANYGPIGTTVTLSGEHLATGGAPRVFFNALVGQDNTVSGTPAEVVGTPSDREISVNVPGGARSGNIAVIADGIPSNGTAYFRVLKGLMIRGADALGLGESVAFQAIGVDTEEQPVPNVEVNWTSSDPTVGSVHPTSGLFTAGSHSGTTALRCTDRLGRLVGQHLIQVLLTTRTFISFNFYRSGPVRGLFAATVDSNRVLFAVGYDGTAMKSTDRAASWTDYALPPHAIVVSDAAADPVPGNLYMGLTDGRVYYVPVGSGSGTWTQVGPTSVGNKNMPICAVTSDGSNLYVGLWDGTVYVTPVAGLGHTSVWTQVGNGPVQGLRAVTRLRVAAGTLYAGLGNSYTGASASNVYQTALAGDNSSVWEAVGTGAQSAGQGVSSLANDGSNLYAGTVNHLYATSLAGSGAGSPWSELGSAVSDESSGTAYSNTSIVRGSGADEELLAAVGNYRIYRTTAPGGAGSGEWSPFGAKLGYFPGNANPVVILADGEDTFAGATNGLVYQLPAGGAWQQPNTTVIANKEESVETLTSDGHWLFAGGQGGIAFRPLDGSLDWLRNNLGNLSVRALAGAGSDLFAALDGFAIARISELARSWSYFVPVNPVNESLQSTRSLLTVGSTLFAGGADGTVWRSPLTAPSWAEIGTAPVPGDPVAVLASDGLWLLAGTAGGAVFRTSLATLGSGSIWAGLVGYPGNGKPIRALVARAGAVLVGSADGNVYLFDPDSGAWSTVGGALVAEGFPVTALASDGASVFAGTAGRGVFKAALREGNWTSFGGPALANATVTALVLQGNHLYVSTSGMGIFWTQ